MITITKERLLTIKQWRETYGPGSNVVLPAEEAEELARIALASLEREQIRHEHAKWSDSTFGCVGPIGPLKHLSKEALEAAAEPDDLSEWADMQFLLWDAQRRAGISDAEITAAMEDKLKINMKRQWPEPKDGEPRLHIKEPGNSPVTPGGWISCSERMPVIGELNWRTSFPLLITCEIGVIPAYYGFVSVNGDRHYGFMESLKYGDDSGGHPQTNEYGLISNVTHWMPLPEPPSRMVNNAAS
ncbi:TPA: dATP/dGTP pyrophosphohydrolase domain-containing protein [Escherichia coli]